MKIFKLIAKLRKHYSKYRLTSTQKCLYYELVVLANSERWPTVFSCNNKDLCHFAGMTEKTLVKARTALINAGLIFYKAGTSIVDVGEYSFEKPFFEEEGESTEEIPVETTVRTTVQTTGNIPVDTYNKTKTNKNNKKGFKDFVNLYPGKKRNVETEWNKFFEMHEDAEQQICSLTPALQNQIKIKQQRRQKGLFVPEYPSLQRWLRERRWEEVEIHPGEEEVIHYAHPNWKHR